MGICDAKDKLLGRRIAVIFATIKRRMEKMTSISLHDITRWLFALLGCLATQLAPTLPYFLICTALILIDCYTAWQLQRRVCKAHPEKVHKEAHKFRSKEFGKVLVTIGKSYVLVALAYFIHTYITGDTGVDMTKIVAGAICFWQLWSILENESSCNGAKWAKIAQQILVDKTSRHFDVDLKSLNINDLKDRNDDNTDR
jgi:hypothetical protein